MKSVIALAIVGLVATASAQGISDLPTCAVSCLASGASGCDSSDIKCACSNSAFITSSSACIDSACPDSDKQKAQAVASAICESAGVTIATPSATGSSAAAPSAAATTTFVSSRNGTTKSSPTATESSSTRALNTTTTAVPTASTGSRNVTQTSSTPAQATNAGDRLGSIGGLALFGLGLAGYLAV